MKSRTMPTKAFHRLCSDLCRRPVPLGRTCRGLHSGVAVNLTSVDVLCFSNVAALAPYAHMPRVQECGQITTCTVVCSDSDLGPVCDGPFTSQHEIAGSKDHRRDAIRKFVASHLSCARPRKALLQRTSVH